MIIFLDELPTVILALSKFLSTLIIVLIAFKIRKLAQFIKLVFIFFFSSLIVLGFVVGVCFIFKLDFIAVNNSVIYFDISAATIITSAFVAYVLSTVILRFYNRCLSKKEIYTLIIENKNKTETFVAFLDTGNKLREPFSGMPVILIKKSKAENLIQDSKIRMVPITTVNKTSLIPAFKPDKILLKTTKNSEVIDNAYVALWDGIEDNGFTAILNCDILSI